MSHSVAKIVDFLLCDPEGDRVGITKLAELEDDLFGTPDTLYIFDEELSDKLGYRFNGFIPVAGVDRDEMTIEFSRVIYRLPRVFKAINDACAECGWWYEVPQKESNITVTKSKPAPDLDITEEKIRS